MESSIRQRGTLAVRGDPLELGPWPRGIVNTIEAHAIPSDGLADALNCNLDEEGYVSSREQYVLLDDMNPYRDMFTLDGQTYAVSQGYVGLVGPSSFDTIHPASGRVSWTVLNGVPVFCDGSGVYTVQGVSATQLVMSETTDEEARYGFSTMPGGSAVAYWQGRLLVLRGRSLLWSEALAYGTHSSSRNFVRFSTTPTWMAPVASGVYVGLRDSVIFLAGTNPMAFTLRTVASRSCPGSGIVVEAGTFDEAVSGLAAVWFSDAGFVVGTGEGSVVYPQAENIGDIPIVPRKISLVGDRLYAFIDEE
jgi:hypothetical protein